MKASDLFIKALENAPMPLLLIAAESNRNRVSD